MFEAPSKDTDTTNVSNSVRQIERSLSVYLVSVFKIDARDYRNYRQRAILVSPKSKNMVQDKIESLAQEIAAREGADDPENYFRVEVLDNDDFIDKKREQRPQDSAIISISRPLTIAKRSPHTGRLFYDDSYNYCPETSAQLRYVIAVEPE